MKWHLLKVTHSLCNTNFGPPHKQHIGSKHKSSINTPAHINNPPFLIGFKLESTPKKIIKRGTVQGSWEVANLTCLNHLFLRCRFRYCLARRFLWAGQPFIWNQQFKKWYIFKKFVECFWQKLWTNLSI